jgi:hypothetical protein
MLAMVGFAQTIEAATSRHAEALAALPYDEEVRELDQQQEDFVAAWRACSDWRQPGFPRAPRAALLLGDALVVLACALNFVPLLRCFERYSVADRFDAPPLEGDALRIIVAPQGWVVIVAWLLACLLLGGYRLWLARRARAYVARGGGAEAPGEPLRAPVETHANAGAEATAAGGGAGAAPTAGDGASPPSGEVVVQEAVA